MSLPGFSHQIVLYRYAATLDAENTPTGGLVEYSTEPGYFHAYAAQEMAAAATLGDYTTARCLVEYGSEIEDQDIIGVTPGSGVTERYRVVRARDNHICLRLDLASETV